MTFKDGHTLLISKQFSSNYGVEFIEFADGTVLDAYGIIQATYEDATEEADKLYGGNQDDVISGLGGDDIISGANGNDTLNGDAGNDSLSGGSHDDVLNGGEGNDSLYGGNDNDTLNGGVGNDRLRGDNGADVFRFDGNSFGKDTISDFNVNSDTIQVDENVFANFEDVLELASNVGNAVVIQLDDDNSITMNGVRTEDLQATNFEFLI
nr:calcium-binding protein [Pseudovibrio sp. FO-BEG1]